MKDKNLKLFLRRGLAAAVTLAAALALGRPAAAQNISSEEPSANARALALDAEDYHFVQPVCTRCHTGDRFLHYRTWSEWQRIFSQMAANGAQGTDEQWGHIYKFFWANLTEIDVNHAFEDELSAVLGIDEKTAIAIVRRQPIKNADDLKTIPGVDKARIDQLGTRLQFGPGRL